MPLPRGVPIGEEVGVVRGDPVRAGRRAAAGAHVGQRQAVV